jgi:hydrogenase maturation protease
MAPRVLVAGIGNLFLGDDGFGPEVVRRLAAVPLAPGVTVTDYGIRGMHLAFDLLAGYDALGAGRRAAGGRVAGEVVVRSVERTILVPASSTRTDEPAAVLGGLSRMGGTLPPTYVVGFRTAQVAEGIGLSPAAAAAVPAAITAIRALLDRIGTEHPPPAGGTDMCLGIPRPGRRDRSRLRRPAGSRRRGRRAAPGERRHAGRAPALRRMGAHPHGIRVEVIDAAQADQALAGWS